MSIFTSPYKWPKEPDGAVDFLATYVDRHGEIWFTGPGGHISLTSPPTSHHLAGTNRVGSVAEAALIVSRARQRRYLGWRR